MGMADMYVLKMYKGYQSQTLPAQSADASFLS